MLMIFISHYKSSSITIYKRYVDDIFCLMENGMEAEQFLDYLNNKYPNVIYLFSLYNTSHKNTNHAA